MKGQELKLSLAGAVVLLVAGAIGAYWYISTKEAEIASLTSDYESRLASVSAELAEAERQNEELGGTLAEEKGRNEAFANQIEDISGTVSKLDKLAKTDPELLNKYSKVYFLNENYAPTGITLIDEAFVYGNPDEYAHEQVYPFLKHMLEEAKEDGVDLQVISGYRSFRTQAALKSSYKVTYGSGANTFSADQGYSEHQLGTAFDFTNEKVGATFTGFDATEAYAWLRKNAHKYGFILSYPKNNTYYQYEPWHWRFVGTDLARDLNREEKFFYDLDQREIDTYLINLFD